MITFNQLADKRRGRVRKQHKSRGRILDFCPFKKGICLKVTTVKPKKPNSSNRKIARVLLSNNRQITVCISGQGHNLQEHSNVLVRGGRVRDLPGVKFKLVRGKYDFLWKEDIVRMQSRSKYGTPKLR